MVINNIIIIILFSSNSFTPQALFAGFFCWSCLGFFFFLFLLCLSCLLPETDTAQLSTPAIWRPRRGRAGFPGSALLFGMSPKQQSCAPTEPRDGRKSRAGLERGHGPGQAHTGFARGSLRINWWFKSSSLFSESWDVCLLLCCDFLFLFFF